MENKMYLYDDEIMSFNDIILKFLDEGFGFYEFLEDTYDITEVYDMIFNILRDNFDYYTIETNYHDYISDYINDLVDNGTIKEYKEEENVNEG